MVKSSVIRSDQKARKQTSASPEKAKGSGGRAIHVVKEPGIEKPGGGGKGGEGGGMNPLIRETLKGWIKGRRVSLKELMSFVVDEMSDGEIDGQKEDH